MNNIYNWFLNIFKLMCLCRNKHQKLLFSVEYNGPIQWTKTVDHNVFYSESMIIKPFGPKYLTIRKCVKCGTYLVGIDTSHGSAPLDFVYIQALFQSVTGKTVSQIVEVLE